MNGWIVTSIRLTARPALRASGIQNLQTAAALAEAGHGVLLWVAVLEPGGREAAEAFLGRGLPPGLRLLAYRPRGAAGEKKTPFASGAARWINLLRARLAAPAPDFVLSRSPLALEQLRAWGVLPESTRRVLEYQYPEWAQLWRGWRRKHPDASPSAGVAELRRLRGSEATWIHAAHGVLHAAPDHRWLLDEAGYAGPARLFPSACLPPEAHDPQAMARREAAAGWELGYAGGFEPENGIELLLAALAELPGLRLKIVGGGEREAALRELAGRLGVGERVTWTGRVPYTRVRAEMQTCRLGVAPFAGSGGVEKRRYASPLKVIEWLGAGVPLLAAYVASVTRLPGSGGALRLFESGNRIDLVRQVQVLLNDAEARASQLAAGHALAEAHAYPARARRLIELVTELRTQG